MIRNMKKEGDASYPSLMGVGESQEDQLSNEKVEYKFRVKECVVFTEQRNDFRQK